MPENSTTTGMSRDGALHDAYDHCLRLTRAHYENFPVASLFLLRESRPALAAVYAFARQADDMADEGALSPEERLARLDDWQHRFDRALEGDPDHPVFAALADTIARYAIPRQLFDDLLTAFRWDITRHRYASFQDLLGYCRCSANPVGRIVLYVFRDGEPRHASFSDSLCTALQLTNFWQDLRIDLARGRLYIPLEDFRRFRYTEEDLQGRVVDDRFRALLRFEVDRTREMFRAGKPLVCEAIHGLRLELALTWNGGTSILRMIERSGYDVLHGRPRLRLHNKLSVLIRSLVPGLR